MLQHLYSPSDCTLSFSPCVFKTPPPPPKNPVFSDCSSPTGPDRGHAHHVCICNQGHLSGTTEGVVTSHPYRSSDGSFEGTVSEFQGIISSFQFFCELNVPYDTFLLSI